MRVGNPLHVAKHCKDALKHLKEAARHAEDIPRELAAVKAAFEAVKAGRRLSEEDLLNYNGKLPEGMDGSE